MEKDSQTSIFRQESLERLSSPEQLDQLMQIVHSRSWLSLAALASLVGLALAWSIFGRIPIMIAGKGILVQPTRSSNQLIGLAYFDRNEGGRIQPGMEMTIVPIGSERMGGIVGRVKTVSVAPITTLEEARQADTATLQPESIEVLVELERDASTVSGYRWSSAAGERLNLSAGMPTTARITLEQKAPIAFAFPFLEAQ